ncbi:hypothetical protein K431DRAFT_343933 [Polychaeton citri CBS 116435]|uniref:Uncharacterized protein n=1 Tax=Polychaeton citri CBS 116435 TaxID=1314669 RepID=A0A9P4QCA5_9PEZI|nr:hypothetical protein K431DRAFT_343933 [Polychaeton citri CBS 116435]
MSPQIQIRLFIRLSLHTTVPDVLQPLKESLISEAKATVMQLDHSLGFRDKPDSGKDCGVDDLTLGDWCMSNCASFELPLRIDDSASSRTRMFVMLSPVKSVQFHCTLRGKPVYKLELKGVTIIMECNEGGVRSSDAFNAVLDRSLKKPQDNICRVCEDGSIIVRRSNLRVFLGPDVATIRQYDMVMARLDSMDVLNFTRGNKLIETKGQATTDCGILTLTSTLRPF